MPRSFILPGQPTQYARSRAFNIDHTKLEIELDFQEESIRGRVMHTIEPLGKPITAVELDSAELSIETITCSGKAVPQFETRSKSILIPLGFALGLGEKIDLAISYSGTPRRGLYFRGPTAGFPERRVHAFTQGQAEDSKFWFPCYDYPNMRTTSETLITLPSNMVVVANGRLVKPPSEGKDGKRKTWHHVQEVPHAAYLLSLVAGDFKQVRETHSGVLLEYVYPEGRDGDAKRSFGNTPRMIDFFSKVTGSKYPYPKYSQSVVSDFMFGGMENITATTLTDRTLHDERSHLDFTSDYLVAHELAHQWFGDLLTCKDWSHAWLNEGFATYMTALWVESDRGADEFQYYMYLPTFDNLSQELDRYHRAIVTKRYWDADELFDHHTYEKGAWVLNGLRGLLGDEVFFRAIRNYVEKFRNSIVETGDYRRELELASGVDLESFFEQWVYSPGFPEYSVSYDWNPEQKLVELRVEQTNAGKDDTPLFTTPIEVRFTFKDGSKVSSKISPREKKNTFCFSFTSAPDNVNLDPGNWVLKRLKFSKPKEMHAHQLRNDDNAMERIRAAMELASFPTDDVINVLSAAVDDDKSWCVRLEAAKALGKIGTQKALEALLTKTSSDDHRVRRGIAFGLRGFTNLDESQRARAVDALVHILENDQAYYARGYAAWSLGFYKRSDKAFHALERAISQESINDIIRYRIFLGYSVMGDKRAIPLAIRELELGKWHQGRMLAAYCLGKIGRGSEDAKKALLEARNIPIVYVKDEAATAIGELGDQSVIPELEDWLAHEPEGRTRRRLRESINLLSSGSSEEERLSQLDGEIKALKEGLKKIEGKFSESEAKVNGPQKSTAEPDRSSG